MSHLSRLAGYTMAATLTLSVLGAAPAFATEGTPAPCTLSAEGVQTAKDEIVLLKRQLRGIKPKGEERKAIVDAIAELGRSARGAKLSNSERAAKRAEQAALREELKATTDAAQRAAIRAELHALREGLETGRLTKEEKAALRLEREELKRSLNPRPSRADKKAAQEHLRALKRAVEACTGVGC